MIAIGRMAEKFGMLPHKVEQNATTYDLMIVDVLATYDKYQHDKQDGKLDPTAYKTEDLQTLLEQTRGG